jgi:hypothetical protein
MLFLSVSDWNRKGTEGHATSSKQKGTLIAGLANVLEPLGEINKKAYTHEYKYGVDEFIRRLHLHVLPKGFHRIRHYGLFAGSNRAETLADVRELFNLDPPPAEQTTESDPAQPLVPFSFLDRAGLLASRILSLQPPISNYPDASHDRFNT